MAPSLRMTAVGGNGRRQTMAVRWLGPAVAEPTEHAAITELRQLDLVHGLLIQRVALLISLAVVVRQEQLVPLVAAGVHGEEQAAAVRAAAAELHAVAARGCWAGRVARIARVHPRRRRPGLPLVTG